MAASEAGFSMADSRVVSKSWDGDAASGVLSVSICAWISVVSTDSGVTVSGADDSVA